MGVRLLRQGLLPLEIGGLGGVGRSRFSHIPREATDVADLLTRERTRFLMDALLICCIFFWLLLGVGPFVSSFFRRNKILE